jgi:hypothetical protein
MEQQIQVQSTPEAQTQPLVDSIKDPMSSTHHGSSRLARKEQKKAVRQTFIFLFGAVILLVLFIFVIIPGVIRLTLAILGPGGAVAPTDDIPPQVPALAAPVPATFSAQIDIKGYTEAGSTVTLLLNGSQHQETTSADDGSFTLPVSLGEGENQISAFAKDAAGNESAESKAYTVVFDSEAPKLDIIEPQEGQQIELRKNQITSITGVTEKNAKVYINGRMTLADSEGAFKSSYQLQEGENKIMIEAVDQAGNKTSKELTVNFRF